MFETDKKDLQYAPKGPIFEDSLNYINLLEILYFTKVPVLNFAILLFCIKLREYKIDHQFFVIITFTVN